MPYVPGAGAHGVVHVADVYHSPNVFANNVPVALWQPPGESAAFAGVSISIAVNVPAAELITANALVGDYVSAQQPGSTATNQYYSPAAAADGVKGNYAGTVDDGTTATAFTGTISSSVVASDIIPFLQDRLGEASRGMWRESGQAGAASNKNIVGIWTNLGYPSASPWTTDQTAWCMGFVNFALKGSGYRYVQTASAAAITQNPERWGATQVPKEQAQPGDIAFWSYRHVNFVYTANNGKYSFVGGNQSPAGGNNPNDGDITNSWPNGTPATNPNWVSCWRPSKT